jgi:hypothetical protein
MVRAIREIVMVGSDGLICVRAPELGGTRAEVIVLPDPMPVSEAPGASLAALDALQQNLRLDLLKAQDWAGRAGQERKASSRL